MSLPSKRAASRTFVPFGTVTDLPSIVSVTVSLVTFTANHVDHAEDRDDVADQAAMDQLARRRQVDERRRSAVRLVRPPGAVRDDEEAELAVAALDERVAFARRHANPVDDMLEMPDHRLDRVVGVALGRQ